MTKMERVKAGLRACRQVACPDECPYIGMCTDGETVYMGLHVEGLEVIEDLEARLPGKAEPVIGETVEFGQVSRWYQCGVCGHPVDRGDLYCRMCGAAVIWD